MKISEYLSFATLIEKNLPFYIATIGNPKYQPPVHRPLGIEDYQLLYTLGGEGCCFINGKSYTVRNGDLVFLPPDAPHEYYCSADSWETLYITFNGNGLKGFFDFEPTVLSTDSELKFTNSYKKLYILKNNPEMFKQASIELYSLLLAVREFTAPSAAISGKKMHLMTRALHYMSGNRDLSRTDDLVIAAHNYESHFGKLTSLTAGDSVTFTDMDGIVNEYVVNKVEVLDPHSVEEVEHSGYALVLYTCTYGGKTRVTVFCDRAS